MAKRKVKAKKVPPKKPLDDGKVMDVSKPGTAKPVATSRPVVTTFGAMMGVDKAPADIKQPTAIPIAAAPSLSHKVIAPINAGVKPEEEGSAAAAEAPKAGTPATADVPAEKDAGIAPEKPAEEPAEEEKSESSNDTDEETGSSAAGEVGALADAASDKKAEEKALEEQSKKEAAVQELVASKKYFVPLAHDSTKKKSSKVPLIMLLVIIIAATGAYLAVDDGLVDPGFDVPYHILKK